jgi:hypothetical protein
MNKRELANLILGTSLIVIFSAALILVIHKVQTGDLAAQGYQYDFYADHHSQYHPELYINHVQGRPGSYFRISGYGYPAYSQAAIMVNERYLAGILVDGYGYFVFQFNTDQANDGLYVIVVSVNPSAATQFVLDSSSPNLWPEEFGDVFSVPERIALTRFIYLPVILAQ